MQLSVDWLESTEEVLLIAQMFLLILGIIWSVWPGFSHVENRFRRTVATSMAVVLLYAGIHAAIYFYSWHIRPNVGLYQEPHWVSKHPEFQKQLRARIESNRWRKSD